MRRWTIAAVLLLAPACASTWGTARDAVCRSEKTVASGVNALGAVLGVPGTVGAAIVNGLLGLACGAAETVAETGGNISGATVDKVAGLVGLAKSEAPAPPK